MTVFGRYLLRGQLASVCNFFGLPLFGFVKFSATSKVYSCLIYLSGLVFSVILRDLLRIEAVSAGAKGDCKISLAAVYIFVGPYSLF